MFRVFHRYYRVFGYDVEIRIVSPAFRATEAELSRLLDDKCYREFKHEIGHAYLEYGMDPDLVRLDEMCDIELDGLARRGRVVLP